MMRHIKILFLSICLLMLTVIVTGCGKTERLELSTGSSGGIYYQIGEVIARTLTKNGVGTRATSTGGSIANINKLEEGKCNLALVQANVLYYAINDLEMFKDGKVAKLEAIASLYPEVCQVIVLDSSEIKSINDLRGKKVAVGTEDSGSEIVARQILEAYKITYNDLEPQFISFDEAARSVADGSIAAAFITAATPTTSIKEAVDSAKIRMLSLDNDKVQALTEKFPLYNKTTISPNTYENIEEEIRTISVMTVLVANDSIDTEMGEKIAKIIFDNPDKFIAAHPIGKRISRENALNGIDFIKLNDGAAKVLK